MNQPIPDWFWIMFVIVVAGLVGLGFQLRRVEHKLDTIWRYFKESG